MPLAPIDNIGTCIYYEDSGAPNGGSTYTTLVFVHGAFSNSAIFEHMLPLATKHGLRMITMNNRDYRGSTPYSADELADFTNADTEVQASAVRRWGSEIARFLAYLCDTLHIPAIATDRGKKVGGLVLVTWSLSGMAALSLLGDPRTMGENLTSAVEPYLRSIVLYDSPCIIYGAVPDIGLTFPSPDPNAPPEREPDAALEWVSSYFPPLPDGQSITPELLQAYSAALPRTPTLRALSAADYQRIIDPSVAARSLAIMATDPAIRAQHAHTAFCDAGAVLPDVDVLALWCDQSVWLTAWAAKVFQDFVRRPAEPGKRKRNMAFLRVNNANHFAHWDEPGSMMDVFAELCRPISGFVSSKL
ncbi:alpha/beta hydrolase [Phanerochaete sordida]|uniref:Alpha/beta hydrolase n=1 Tax=Phanerochaete sordida TaxID=48140 RepID=A0A9P3GA14_9APHY|nr:alpha/beta hydrolase [Phanerochaete sordida]